MNSTSALFVGMAIGCAAGAAGFHFLEQRSTPPPIATSVAIAPAQVATPDEPARHDQESDDWGMEPAPTARPAFTNPQPDSIRSETIPSVANEQPAGTDGFRRNEWTRMSAEERQQQFFQFQSNRAAAARAAFVSTVATTKEERVHFDVLVAAMNLRLAEKLDPLLQRQQAGWRPSTEERVRLMTDVGTIIVGTYDEIDRSMPEGWREASTNTALNLTHLVSPQYLPLMRGFTSRQRPPFGGSRGR